MNVCYFDLLPNEIVTFILCGNEHKWRGVISQVCKHWNNINDQYYHNTSNVIDNEYIVISISLVEWRLQRLKYPSCSNIHLYAARHGYLEILKFLCPQYIPLTSCLYLEASKYNHLDIIKWLKENDCPYNNGASIIAAENGYLEILKYFYNNISRDRELGCAYAAARGGNLNILQWLYDNDYCDINIKGILILTVKHGHLELLKYLHKNGCKLTQILVVNAASWTPRNIKISL